MEPFFVYQMKTSHSTSRQNKRAYNEFTEEEKLEAINEYKREGSYRKVAQKFNVSHVSVRNWVQNEDVHVEHVKKNKNVNLKRVSRLTGDNAELDLRVFNWFAAARSHNLPISGPILQQTALQVAQGLGMIEFKASSGWLNSFCKRNCIAFKVLSGESASMNHEVVQNWQECLPHLLQGYEPKDVRNIDETGLFWKGLPTRSLVMKSEQAKGGKLAKERLTVCLLCSAEGKKFKPLVIGKAAMPRAFDKKLPSSVCWDSNSK